MKWKFIQLPSVYSYTYSLTHLSAWLCPTWCLAPNSGIDFKIRKLPIQLKEKKKNNFFIIFIFQEPELEPHILEPELEPHILGAPAPRVKACCSTSLPNPVPNKITMHNPKPSKVLSCRWEEYGDKMKNLHFSHRLAYLLVCFCCQGKDIFKVFLE